MSSASAQFGGDGAPPSKRRDSAGRDARPACPPLHEKTSPRNSCAGCEFPAFLDDRGRSSPPKMARQRPVGTRGSRVRLCTKRPRPEIPARAVISPLPRTTEAGHPHQRWRDSAGRDTRLACPPLHKRLHPEIPARAVNSPLSRTTEAGHPHQRWRGSAR